MAAMPSRPTRRRVLTSSAIIGATVGIQTIPLSAALALSAHSNTESTAKLATKLINVSTRRRTNSTTNQRVQWSAQLVTVIGNAPVTDESVSITFVGYTLASGGTATTNSAGIAESNAKPLVPAGVSFTIRFIGNAIYEEAEFSGNVA